MITKSLRVFGLKKIDVTIVDEGTEKELALGFLEKKA